MKRFAVWSVLVFLPLAVAAQVDSIADARSAPLGATVTVEGSVTVPSGRYATSTFDQGFAVEDDTAGIYVSTGTNSQLTVAERVRVTGTIDTDGFGLLVIRPTSIETLVGRAPLRPASLTTGEVGENTEGLFVVVEGAVTSVENDIPFGYKVFIDDGSGETQVFIPASTGINPFALPFVEVGAAIRAVGFSAQFADQYEVLPRFDSDLAPARP